MRSRPVGFSLLTLLVAALVAVWVGSHAQHASRRALAMAAQRTDGGIALRLSVPAGPYFHDELLPVTLTLANHSGRAIDYLGTMHPSFCVTPVFMLTLAHAGSWLTPYPYLTTMSCPIIPPKFNTLPPGRSVSQTRFTWLHGAGRLTLSVQAAFPPDLLVHSAGLLPSGSGPAWLRAHAGWLYSSSHPPFAAGWPSLTISVGAHTRPAPLRLIRHGHRVTVVAPPRAGPLVLQQAADCENDQAYTGSSTPDWVWAVAHTIVDAGCPGFDATSEKWSVTVGMHGYSVVTASYCFNPDAGPIFVAGRGLPASAGCTERSASL